MLFWDLTKEHGHSGIICSVHVSYMMQGDIHVYQVTADQ